MSCVLTCEYLQRSSPAQLDRLVKEENEGDEHKKGTAYSSQSRKRANGSVGGLEKLLGDRLAKRVRPDLTEQDSQANSLLSNKAKEPPAGEVTGDEGSSSKGNRNDNCNNSISANHRPSKAAANCDAPRTSLTSLPTTVLAPPQHQSLAEVMAAMATMMSQQQQQQAVSNPRAHAQSSPESTAASVPCTPNVFNFPPFFGPNPSGAAQSGGVDLQQIQVHGRCDSTSLFLIYFLVEIIVRAQ